MTDWYGILSNNQKGGRLSSSNNRGLAGEKSKCKRIKTSFISEENSLLEVGMKGGLSSDDIIFASQLNTELTGTG